MVGWNLFLHLKTQYQRKRYKLHALSSCTATDTLSPSAWGSSVIVAAFKTKTTQHKNTKNKQKPLLFGAWLFLPLISLHVHLNYNLMRNIKWATYLLGLQLESRREGNSRGLTSCLPETDTILPGVQSWQWIHVLNCFLFAGKEVGFVRVYVVSHLPSRQGGVCLDWCQWLFERHCCLWGST